MAGARLDRTHREHGDTGLDAKPVIDIMAGVESLDGSRAALSVLERHQYCYAPY